MSQSDAGKTDKRRPCLVSREEEDLRYRLALGRIDLEDFVAGMKLLKKGEPIYKACEYKGTFAGCSPFCCAACAEEQKLKGKK